ncbi:MAG TPA: hypothetical protein PKH77_07590 [Anaerolineae bacterium]|nr:hypothetical protein [Anaerolineae bacterium]
MAQTITLTLPEGLYQPLARAAQVMSRPIEDVLLNALQSALPSLEGLPEPLVQELNALELLDNAALQRVLLETVPTAQQQKMEELLHRNQAEGLSLSERERLKNLQNTTNRVMLRKARAAVLLRFRGQRILTLAELRQLTLASS